MSNNILFIHIPKTGGTSILRSLPMAKATWDHMDKSILKEFNKSQYVEFPWYNSFAKHIPYSYMDSNIIQSYNKIFSVVRNPWSRLVSLYNYTFSERMKSSIGTSYFQDFLFWDEFLDRMDSYVEDLNFFCNHPYDQWACQEKWLGLKVDVLRYECLNYDLNRYLGKSIRLEMVNTTKKVDYKSYYTNEQRDRVEKWFQRDIDRWGFSFDTSATKNYWGENAKTD